MCSDVILLGISSNNAEVAIKLGNKRFNNIRISKRGSDISADVIFQEKYNFYYLKPNTVYDLFTESCIEFCTLATIPHNLVITDISSHEACVHWNSSGEHQPSKFLLRLFINDEYNLIESIEVDLFRIKYKYYYEYIFRNLTPGQKYFIYISAINQLGFKSEQPNPVIFYTKCGIEPMPLPNINGNCYFNSAIQAISSCDKLLNQFEELYNKCPSQKLASFVSFIRYIRRESNEFNWSFLNELINNWNKTGEQDSFEFISYICNEIFGDIKMNINNMEICYSSCMPTFPMRILHIYTFSCLCGNSFDTPKQTDLAFHLSIHQCTDIQNLINYHFEPMYFEYNCENYNCTYNTSSKIKKLFTPLPTTLCIHLQRQYWNGHEMVLNDNRVKILKNIILNNDFIENNSKCECNINYKYQIVSVIVHYGYIDTGHYVCYKWIKDTWYFVNDLYYEQVDESVVLNCNPYILFYEFIDYDV